MPRNKIGLEFEGLEEIVKELEEKQKSLKQVAEKALKQSAIHATKKIEKAFVKKNMPAKGLYATGITKKSIVHDFSVNWEGTTGSVKVGFWWDISGLTSIFLIYGTPKMQPVKGLKTAIYGKKTKEEIKEIQKNIFSEAIGK